MENTIDIICMESEAFFNLIERVINRLSKPLNEEDVWLTDYEAMKLLKISSKTTLQKLRDNNSIRFTRPRKKIILYDKKSITSYLKKCSNI